jgi:hypothetical protein
MKNFPNSDTLGMQCVIHDLWSMVKISEPVVKSFMKLVLSKQNYSLEFACNFSEQRLSKLGQQKRI